MTVMTFGSAEDRDVAAGEYVIGTLVGAERDAFEAALAGDATLQAMVYAWQDRLLDLARRAPPEAPEASVWARIESRLSASTTRSVAANDSLWQRVRTWQWTTGMGLAATVVLAAMLFARGPAPASERYLAVLQSPDGTRATGWVVEITSGQQVRLIPAGDGARDAPPAGKALQFWTKPRGAAGPTSLGLVRAGQTTEVSVAKLPALGEQQLFEVTLEPETGSPIGRPTGPVLFVGSTLRL